jgi:N-acetylglutamate synthase-like GNAT family acetyltransferase
MIVDLKKSPEFINQYVLLRNRFLDLLLTDKVTEEDTKNWLKNKNVEVICSIEENVLIGACIIHLYREGEITIFVKKSRKGTGTLLLKEVESVAKKKGLNKIWAFTRSDNSKAENFFLINGYHKKGSEMKKHKTVEVLGTVFEKKI